MTSQVQNWGRAQTIEYRAVERGPTSLGDLVAILARHFPSIALLTIAATGLAVLYLALTTPVYTASTSVFIDPRSRNIVPEEVLKTNIAADQVLVESQVSIMGSDGVLRRVVEKEKLAEDPEFAIEPAFGLLSRLKALIIPRGPQLEKDQQAIATLAEKLKVKRAQKTYVVDVEVSSRSPAKAARLSGAIVEAYLDDQSASKSDEARRVSSMIDSRLGELRTQLRQAEIRVDEFKKENKILSSEGGLINEQQLTRLNRELVTAQAVAAESKARLDLVTSALKNGGSPEFLPDAIRSGLVQRLREQFAQVARREAALSTQLQGRHPVLIEARSQLSEIKQQIAAELKRVSTSAQSEHQIATNRVAELTRELEKAQAGVSRTNTAQIRLRELEQEVATSRDLLNTFLTRAKQTQEQQKLSIAEARVISPASVPTRASKPVGWLVLALGLLGGLGLGIGRALVVDHFESSRKTRSDVSDASVEARSDVVAQTEFKTFATIPTLADKTSSRHSPGRGATDAIGFGDVMSAIVEPRSSNNGHAFRKAVLRLLTRLRTASRGTPPAMTMIVSPKSAAGASSVALGLAYAAAQSGERVLLIDATSTNTDLSNVLAKDFNHQSPVVLDNKEHLQSITRRDKRTGLAFLPIALADLRTLKPTQKKRLAIGITALVQDYDLVFIDAGAMLEDQSAEAILPIVDQVLLVVRAGETSSDALDKTVKVIEPARDRILGIVLNHTDIASI